MSTNHELSRVTVDMPKAMHKRLKTRAALLGKSMREVILEALESTDVCRCKEHVPNKNTRRALKAAEKGQGLVAVKDIDELFKKLGI